MPEHPPKKLILDHVSLTTILVCFPDTVPPCHCATLLQSQLAVGQDRTGCQVTSKAPTGVGGLEVDATRWWLGRCAGGMPQHPALGAARATEESAFGLVKVEHSSQLAAGFDKAMRTICLISNEGDEGALLPLVGGSAGLSLPHGSGGGKRGGKLTDKRKVRGRKMLGMCFLI